MAQSTSYDLPNYIGELFQRQQRPNAMLRLIASPDGVNVGTYRTVGNPAFAMGVDYVLPAASQPAILEGAQPAGSQIAPTQSTNVVQIFHEVVDMTYSLQARTGQIGGLAVVPGSNGSGTLVQPGTLAFQLGLKLQKIARDINYTLINGVYALPGTNATARKTRGLIAAIATNVAANGGTPRALTKAIIDNALKAWIDNSMFSMGETVYVLGNADQLDKLAALFENVTLAGVYVAPGSTEAGVQLRTLYTRMATLKMVYDFDMPAGSLLFVQPQYCKLTAMPIPGKGVLFSEPLAKIGSSDQVQIYGELGLDYMHEVKHGLIKDLS